MKIKIKQAEFNSALSRVQDAVESNPTIQALSCVRIVAREGSILITSTNIDIDITTTAQCISTDECGVAIVPYRLLAAVVAASVSGDIVLYTLEKERKAVIETPTGSSRISILELDSFPIFNRAKNESAIPFAGASAVLKQVAFALASRHENRGVLKNTLLHIEESAISAVATNGRVLAISECEAKSKEPLPTVNLILPRIATAAITRLAQSVECVTINIPNAKGELPKYAVFEMGDTAVRTKLCADPYPNYKMVIPNASNAKWEATIHGATLLSAVKRAAIFATKELNAIHLTSGHDELALVSSSLDFGNTRERVSAKFALSEGRDYYDGMDICLSAEYLADALESAGQGDIQLYAQSNVAPCLIDNQKGFRAVIMPIREP